MYEYKLCKKLGLLVSDTGLIYADKLEEVLRQAIPLKLCQHNHDVIRADANWTKEHLDKFPNEAIMLRISKD